jgi:pantetheine-phosphate adenylyltransferase
MPKAALYAGSFDPITNGHADLIRRSLTFVDRLVVGVAINVAKQPLFTGEERIALIRAALDDDPRVEVVAFKGLLVEFAKSVDVRLVLRGLRAVADFEYEYQMALMNRHLAPDVETVFMVPSLEVSYLSSSLVREVARFGGDIEKLVHPAVASALREKYRTPSFEDGPATTDASGSAPATKKP